MRITALGIFLFISSCVFSFNRKNDTLNRIDANGERIGWWIFDLDNNPVENPKALKTREGRFVKGRKYGAWISYHEDGKTPRLIGEYADNRPSGSFIRFDKSGKITQAGAVPRKIPVSQFLMSRNSVFSCKLLFADREPIAGQVFFTNNVFMKGYATRFWMEKMIQTETVQASEVSYDWLNENYTHLMTNYLALRSPVKEQLKRLEEKQLVDLTPASRENSDRKLPYYYPPAVNDPIMAPGTSFRSNGINKLFTKHSEIWIDGYFRNGKLESGKVFVYDRDGILLKVRVYKEGVYYADGVL